MAAQWRYARTAENIGMIPSRSELSKLASQIRTAAVTAMSYDKGGACLVLAKRSSAVASKFGTRSAWPAFETAWRPLGAPLGCPDPSPASPVSALCTAYFSMSFGLLIDQTLRSFWSIEVAATRQNFVDGPLKSA
jgi:hypothetical protein